MSQRLYGREEETARLLEAFGRVRDGGSELLLVAGYAGVGKTSLVREVHKPITADHGYFTQGKFDQLENAPYSALVEAFQHLVRGVLTEPEVRVATWRAALREALGGAAAVIVDVLPELTLIIGDVEPAAPLPATESRNRFQRTFRRFVQVFANPDHPLVLFLDDLQWASSASLELLQMLLTDAHTTHLFVIGAFRDNEVGAGHPLQLTIDALDEADAEVTRVDLRPLDASSVAHLVADSLHRAPEAVAPLAGAVYARTHGNPFFVDRLLTALHDEGALTLDADASEWVWDLDRIRAIGVSDNVADLMARRIHGLPVGTRRVLQLAACVGNSFDLETLSMVSEMVVGDVAQELWPAVGAELVRPEGHAYQYVGVPGQSAAEVRYRFAHDRVQEAAYVSGPAPDRDAVHVAIARLLQGGHETLDDRTLFAVVGQYGLGLGALTDEAERRQVARLHLRAGLKAMESGAYREAAGYLDVGVTLAGDDAWSSDPPLAMGLHRESAEAALMCGDFEAATEGFDRCMARAVTTAEKVEIYCRRINLHTRKSETPAAILAGVEGLSLFGFEAPDSPEGWGAATGAEVGKVGEMLQGLDVPGLVDAPMCIDPDVLLELRLLAQIGTPAYNDPAVFGFVNVRVVRLSIEHGNTADSPLAYMLYGFILCTMGQYELGETFGRLALALNDAKGNAAGAAPLNHLFSVFVEHWRSPLSQVRERIMRARTLTLESGIYSSAGWVVMNIPWFCYVQGDPLGNAIAEAQRDLDIAVNTLNAEDVANSIRWTLHQLLKLAGEEGERRALDAAGFSEDALFEKLAHFVPMLGAMRVQRIKAACITGDYASAHGDLPVAAQLAPTFGGSVWQTEYTFYRAMVTTATVDKPSEETDAELDAALAQLSGWADHCEANQGWKRDLLAAEVAGLRGDADGAAVLYDKAIERAQANGFLHGEGLACERAARFYERRGKSRFARGYTTDAHYAYARWGSAAKVAQLEETHPELRPRRAASTIKATTTKTGAVDFLDVGTVLKATRTVSSELVLEDLLRSLITVVIENAGAQRGVLLIRRRDELRIEASAEAGGTPEVLQDTPVDEGAIAASIVRYVARAHAPVVLGDASRSPRFAQDPYVIVNKPRSLLCMPVLNQSHLVGVLYLENNVTTDAFTDERCVLLDMIAAQAAISINNAFLYDSLSRFVPKEFLAVLGRESILDVELGDAVDGEMTVLFSDIRSFTTRSAQMTPEENFRFLNGYLRRVGPVIREHDGFIDKYIGDAVMALFTTGVEHAIRAAIRMNEEATIYSVELEAGGGEPLRIGVGIHFGRMMLGTIGESRRMEGTVISDAVNTGARLESMSKAMGVRIIVSGEALGQLPDPAMFPHRYLGQHVMRGRSEATELYEVFAADGWAQVSYKTATREVFEGAVRAKEAGDGAAARAGLEAVLAKNPGDRAAEKMLASLG